MTSLLDLNDLTEHAKTLDPKAVLGSVAWSNVSSTVKMAHADYKARAELFGLEDYVPGYPADANRFRDALDNGDHGRTSHFNGATQVTTALLVKTVRNDPARLIKWVVAEETDAAGERMSWGPRYEVIYSHGDIQINEMSPNQRAKDLVDRLLAKYYASLGCINPNNVRTTIRDVFDTCYAFNLRGKAGGVYFVDSAHSELLSRLEDFIGFTDDEGISGAVVHSMPLIDDRLARQKTMLTAAAIEDISGDSDRLTAEMGDLLKAGAVGIRMHGSLMEKVAELKAKARHLAEVLDENKLTAAVRVQTLDMQLQQLGTMVRKHGELSD